MIRRLIILANNSKSGNDLLTATEYRPNSMTIILISLRFQYKHTHFLARKSKGKLMQDVVQQFGVHHPEIVEVGYEEEEVIQFFALHLLHLTDIIIPLQHKLVQDVSTNL